MASKYSQGDPSDIKSVDVLAPGTTSSSSSASNRQVIYIYVTVIFCLSWDSGCISVLYIANRSLCILQCLHVYEAIKYLYSYSLHFDNLCFNCEEYCEVQIHFLQLNTTAYQWYTSTVYWCIASKLKAPWNFYWMSDMFLSVEIFLFFVCYHVVRKRHRKLDYELNGL